MSHSSLDRAVLVYDLIAATGGKRQVLPALRMLACGATTVPRQLVSEVPSVFGLPLRAAWGMTEVGISTVHPQGRPAGLGRPQRRTSLRAVRSSTCGRTPRSPGTQPGRLFARGAGVCLATVGRDGGKLTVIADHDDGWYDTGDLAVPDGRGGIRMMGRAGDRIGGALLIPVTDVESELRDPPRRRGRRAGRLSGRQGGELACAVIVPATTPSVDLDELRKYLDRSGHDRLVPALPARGAPALPRNGIGKVRKELLRRWLRGRPTDGRMTERPASVPAQPRRTQP